MLKTILLLPFKCIYIVLRTLWRFGAGTKQEIPAPTTRLGKAWEVFVTAIVYYPCYFFSVFADENAFVVDIFNRKRLYLYKCEKRYRGFTLVEMSIVLVIIGLLVGGIVAGREMIEGAALRKVVSEQEKITTAVMTFKLKYNAIPGDITNATQFWGTDASCPNTPLNTTPKTATCDGNGDGRIYPINIPNTGVQSEKYESFRFWQQLANAGLIEGQYTGVAHTNGSDGTPGINVPRSAYNQTAGWGVYSLWGTGDGTNGFAGMSYSTNYLFIGAERTDFLPNAALFTAQQALSIDTKFDDGLPTNGRVTVNEPPCTTTAVSATALYNTGSTAINCAMWFKAPF